MKRITETGIYYIQLIYGRERLDFNIFTNILKIKSIYVTLDELSLAPSDQSDAKLLESEQKHQVGRGDSTYLGQ